MFQSKSTKSISNRDLHDALKTDYDFYKVVDCAEDVDRAQRHKRAKKVGQIHLHFSKATNDFCQCCKQPCYNAKYDLSTPTDKFAQFSGSASIYFKFNIFCITVLFIGFVFYGVIGNLIVAENITARKCFFSNCIMDRLFIQAYTSLSHKIFFIIFFIATIILKDAFFIYLRKYNFQKDEEKITPSDYTAFITDIDPKLTEGQIETELKHYFQKMDKNIELKKINLIYDIQNQVELVRQYSILKRKETVLEKKISYNKKTGRSSNDSKIQKYIEQLREIKRDLRKINSDIKEITDGSQSASVKFTGKAFVTFATQQSLRNVVRRHQSKILNIKFKKGSYSIQRAVEPQDIIWENLGVQKLQKFKRRFLSYFVSLVLVAISFFIILGLSFAQENISIDNVLTRYGISILISFIIIIINLGIRFSLINLTKNEKRTTYTHQEYNIVFKITLVYFTNMALIILITNIFVFDNKFNLVLWNSSGVAAKTQIVLALTCISDFLFTMFNPFYLLKRSQRIYHNKQIKDGKIILQCELNFSSEGIIFDIAAKYYTMFKIVSFCFFYMTLSPYLLLLGIFHLILSYLANKYMLVTKCNRPVDLNFKFSAKMVKNFEFCTLIMAIGYFTLYKIITGEFDVFSIIALIIAAFDWIIMDLYLIHKFTTSKTTPEGITYDDAYLTFPVDYDRENPMTQREAFKDWFDEMNQRRQNANQRIDKKNKIGFSMINPKKRDKKYDFNVLYNYINNGQNMQANLFSNQVHSYDLQNDKNLYTNDFYGDVDLYKLNNTALLRNNNFYYQTQFKKKYDNQYQVDFNNQLMPIDYPLQDIPLAGQLDYQDQPANIMNQKKDFGMFASVFRPKKIKTDIYNVPDDQRNLLNNNTPPQNILPNNHIPNFENRYSVNQQIAEQKIPDIKNNNYSPQLNQYQDMPLNNQQNNIDTQQDLPLNQYAINFNPEPRQNNQNFNSNLTQNNQDQPLNDYQLNFNNQNNHQYIQEAPLNINSQDFRIDMRSEQHNQNNPYAPNFNDQSKKEKDDKKEQLINNYGYVFILTYYTKMCRKWLNQKFRVQYFLNVGLAI